ncbi:28S ribosomal protein S9, mitochondrial [Merluccius polli]|uniref:28S ribosomal protein S9, mitochondrial n=1 Tax=Merluccius polli TaxID=89951 RepID=A0AA47NA45_MERPO|nr:28S ribosomal protein S9, mitochondrial [Merluccius polli]
MAAPCVRTVGSLLGKCRTCTSNINTIKSQWSRQVNSDRAFCSSSVLLRKNLAAAGPEKFTVEFVQKQVEEFNIGKRHLANMMGEDPENFTQEDIDRSIAYLFPSSLFEKRSRPLMKHPEEIFPKQRAVQWGEDGRPFHFLFYTGKQSYYSLMHETYAKILNMERQQDRLRARGLISPDNKPLSLGTSRWVIKEELEEMLVETITDHDYKRLVQLMERLAALPQVAGGEEAWVQRFRRPLEVQARRQEVVALQTDAQGRAYSTAEGRRKTSSSCVILRDAGSGHVTVNGADLLSYFPVFQDR